MQSETHSLQAYHSHFNDKDLLQSAGIRIIGGVPLLPFEARHSQGPAPRACRSFSFFETLFLLMVLSADQFAKNGADIIGEVLKYFKSNVFFQNYEVLVSFGFNTSIAHSHEFLGRCRPPAGLPDSVHTSVHSSHCPGSDFYLFHVLSFSISISRQLLRMASRGKCFS